MKYTSDQIKLAQSCKTPEELIDKTKKEGIALSFEQAQKLLNSVEMVELDENDIGFVSGGCNTTSKNGAKCPACDGTNTVCTENTSGKYSTYFVCNDCSSTFSLYDSENPDEYRKIKALYAG